VNVFITGATGFIGSHLVEKLNRDDRIQTIYCMARIPRPHQAAGKVREIGCTLENAAELRLDAAKIDALIHLAGYWKKEDRKLLYRINFDGTRNVLELCKNNGIPGILFLSTINVKLEHRGFYASSKLEAERLVAASGLKYSIIRPTLVYGKGDSGMSKIVRFIDKKWPVPVFGDGKKIEQPIHVDELVDHICQALFGLWPGGIIEIGGKDAMAYDNMLDQIAQSAGYSAARKIHLPRWPFVAAAKILETLHLPSPITSEQIYHIDEDLVAEKEVPPCHQGIGLRSFSENMKSYRENNNQKSTTRA
jgi:nucleoside-diphosphate-sugar epimerase